MANINDMTELSKQMYLYATEDQLQLKDALDLLKSEANIRRVRDTLASLANIPVDDIKTLKGTLIDRIASGVPWEKRDSIRRKVDTWMKDDARTINREGAIQVAFALELNVQEADLLLKRLCEDGIRWRDPDEIVYFYSLKHGKSYADAKALLDEIKSSIVTEGLETDEKTVYTEQIRRRVNNITSDEELKEYILSSYNSLGKMHNTAYREFMSFLELLGAPVVDYKDALERDTDKYYSEKVLVDIRKYAAREIMDTYLFRRFIPVVQRTGKKKSDEEQLVFSALQKNIRQNWPDEVTLSNMIHRKTDVTRKVLILLFLATDDGEIEYEAEIEEFEYDQEPDDTFSVMYARLDTLLGNCGFAGLDPRIPFDWMVLYCMCVDDSIFVDGRIQRFLADIFPSTEAEPDMLDSEEAWEAWKRNRKL